VLLLATGVWTSTARLALALDALGCEVTLMAQRMHPAAKLEVVKRRYGYKSLRPVESVLEAIRGAQPDAVIPVDELAVLHLEELRAAAQASQGEEQLAAIALLERSGGKAEVMRLGRSRIALMELARRQGVDVPETVAVAGEDELEATGERLGWPLVLKADATFGGRGVRLVENAAEARAAWRLLHRAPSMTAAVRRGMIWNEWTHVRPWARGETRAVVAQKAVSGGRERTAMAMTREGELVAFVCMEVVQASAERGPASVLRVIEDRTMEAAMRKVVAEVGVSGFCGFDFMVEGEMPLLIEMNLRPTQLAHLPLGPGRDLVAAYVREIVGLAVEDRPAATEGGVIALFPQEVKRDAGSVWLREGFHDVPWGQKELVRAVMKGKVPGVVSGDARWG
jgi:biotin carboxylase